VATPIDIGEMGYPLLTYTSLSNQREGLGSGPSYEKSSTIPFVPISKVSAIDEDLNGDGVFDFRDLLMSAKL
jgi:hypothetical protein